MDVNVVCFSFSWCSAGGAGACVTRAGFLFNLIRNPRGYQYIGTSPFPDSFRFAKSHTNPKHHRDWKTQTSSTKYWSWPRLFSFIPSLELLSKNRSHHRPSTASWAGEFFDRIAFFAVYPITICNSTWMTVCPNLASATDSSKQNSYSTKTQILKKHLESI